MAYIDQSIMQAGPIVGPAYLVGPMLTRHKTLRRMRSYCNRTTAAQREALAAARQDPGIYPAGFLRFESYPWKREGAAWVYACLAYVTDTDRTRAIHYLAGTRATYADY